MFSLRPNKFRWVKLRSVRRKTINAQSCMARKKLRNHLTSVNRASIPKQNHTPLQMSQQISQKKNHFHSRNILGMILDIKTQLLTFRRNAERTDRRDAIMLLTISKNRSLSARRPCFTHIWNEEESTFVKEDQMGPKLSRVFLYSAMFAASNKRWLLRSAGELDVPAFGSSTVNSRSRVCEFHPNRNERQIAFLPIGQFVSPSISRSNNLFVSDRPKAVASTFPSVCPKVDKDALELVWQRVPSCPFCGKFDTIESLNSKMPSVFEQQSEMFFRFEARKWLSAFFFLVVGMRRKVSFPNLCHNFCNVSII